MSKNTTKTTKTVHLVTADGAPRGYADRLPDGTFRIYHGGCRGVGLDSLNSGWNFLTEGDLAERGWEVA